MGIIMVRQWADKQFADKADSAFAKIQAELPASLKGELKQIITFAVPTSPPVPWTVSFSAIRERIRNRQK